MFLCEPCMKDPQKNGGLKQWEKGELYWSSLQSSSLK